MTEARGVVYVFCTSSCLRFRAAFTLGHPYTFNYNPHSIAHQSATHSAFRLLPVAYRATLLSSSLIPPHPSLCLLVLPCPAAADLYLLQGRQAPGGLLGGAAGPAHYAGQQTQVKESYIRDTNTQRGPLTRPGPINKHCVSSQIWVLIERW